MVGTRAAAARRRATAWIRPDLRAAAMIAGVSALALSQPAAAATVRYVATWKPGFAATATGPDRFFGVFTASRTEAPALLRRLRSDPRVAAVELDRSSGLAFVPDDPRWAEQVDMQMIGANSAWTFGTGKPVTVAVIDSGIDLTHPDLTERLWTNKAEVPGNRTDDDHNGYVDDVHGVNFRGSGIADDDGHGTHVAGIIAAAAGNGAGIAGIAPNARIMVLKAFGRSGAGGLNSDIARGIDYASANGAKVINLSFGCADTCKSDVVAWAVGRARAAGVLVVAAAGNNHRNNDSVPFYPASYEQDNLIAVASVDPTGALSDFSNFGAVSVDLAAPGLNTLSAWPGGTYRTETGTSMSAPHVAGAAALLMGLYPQAGFEAVRHALIEGVRRSPSLAATVVSGGYLDLVGAIHAIDPDAEPVGDPDFGSSPPDPVVRFSRNVAVCKTGAWSPAPARFTFEWFRGGEAVQASDSSRLVIRDGDFSRPVRCKVHGIGLGAEVTADSSPGVVPNPVLLSRPSIIGRVRVGRPVRCATGRWLYGPFRLSYEWRAGRVRVATRSSYRPRRSDAGRLITCRVWVRNQSGSATAGSRAVRVGHR